MSPDPAFWPALVIAGAGAFLDLKEERLPNWLCAALAVAAIGGLYHTRGLGPLPWAALHAAIALLLGMILFALGMIGGGDAKFYAAAALAIPAKPLMSPMAMLGWTSAAGLLLLVALAIGRRAFRKGPKEPLLRGWSVPYGVAIFAGFAIALARA